MEISTFIRGLGLDTAVVLGIIFVTQVIKLYTGPTIKRFLVVLPIVLGLGMGVVLALDEGIISIIRNGFVYGAVATWAYTFGDKFLGVTLPGDTK